MYCLTDSLTSVKSLRRSVTAKTQRIAIYLAFIKEVIKRKELSAEHNSHDVNVADVQTKQDIKAVLQKLWSNATTPTV